MRSNGKENWRYEKQVMEGIEVAADAAVWQIIYNKYSHSLMLVQKIFIQMQQ